MTTEQKLVALLDRIAEGATLTGASRLFGHGDSFIQYAIKLSREGHADYRIEWRENTLWFHEHIERAQNAGEVQKLIRDRGITIDGEPQFVIDLSLLERFGFGDDAKDLCELVTGFDDYPYAHGSDGKRIRQLSARHPRPQRRHRPEPKPAPEPLPQWTPNSGVPAYARGVRAPAPPPRVVIRTEASPMRAPEPPKVIRAETPLTADLRARAELLKQRGPMNARPEGPPTLASGFIGPATTSEPKELLTGADNERTA